MMPARRFPAFDDAFKDLNEFILELVAAYEAENLNSWVELEERVKAYFRSPRMAQMEAVLPGWQKMASYSDGITLVHVMCVFLGLFMLPEFQHLTSRQKQMAKWIILLHDVDKIHVRGKRDTLHAFRSGIHAARLLPGLGFPMTKKYPESIHAWSDYAGQAFVEAPGESAPIPDNRKLPGILEGIDQLFGTETPAALICKAVLLHISLHVDPFYPTPAPLTEAEIRRYISPSLLPLLQVMMLSDNEGWSLFDPETRARQRKDTLEAFRRVELLIDHSSH